MCQFFSALWTRQGKLLYNYNTHSHEDLIALHDLEQQDGEYHYNTTRRFVRLEFIPPRLSCCRDEKDIMDLDKWELLLDEEVEDAPAWFDPDKARRALENVVRPMFVTGEHKVLVGGAYILVKAGVDRVKNARIAYILNSHIDYIEGSSIGYLGDSRIRYEVALTDIASVIGEHSRFGVVVDSRIGSIKKGVIFNLRGNTRIMNVGGSCIIRRVSDRALVERLGGDSKVLDIRGEARIRFAYDNAYIGISSARVGIGEVFGNCTVEWKGSEPYDVAALIRLDCRDDLHNCFHNYRVTFNVV